MRVAAPAGRKSCCSDASSCNFHVRLLAFQVAAVVVGVVGGTYLQVKGILLLRLHALAHLDRLCFFTLVR